MYYPIAQNYKLKTKNYSDLVPVFERLLGTFLTVSKIMPDEQEDFDLLVRVNMRDLERNRKPEGFNRSAKNHNNRLIFPIVEPGKDIEMTLLITEKRNYGRVEHELSRVLTTAGIEFEAEHIEDYLKRYSTLDKKLKSEHILPTFH